MSSSINFIGKDVVDASIQIHSELGSSLLESVYEIILIMDLTQRGYLIERQRPIE